MKKLLITGSSGFLGWNLCQIAQSEWQVFGTYCSHEITIPGCQLMSVDLTDFPDLKSLFAEICPDAVIHTAAQSQPNVCQIHPEESYKINVTASSDLAGLCGDAEIPCVFTSTDLVFDGLNPPYAETDAVCPVSRYGEQKVEAEVEMRDRNPQTIVCRMPLMFGEGGPAAQSFLQPMLQTWRSGQKLALFTDEFRTPVSGKTAAQGLLLALEQDEKLLHLGGKERVSRYGFFEQVIEVLEVRDGRIKPCRQQDVKMSAPRPPDVSLDSSKAFSLGYNPLPLRSQLLALLGRV
ncbi:NAD(P)-dependent oxidoreductase [Phormidium pseudopriestleyi FRX01]|uniref:NAD(P)-dependent oxidoreductase n=1 Tax=Phormidium pseudopriestleyi FRX01 TaxID=1759528 RepID=A0ABS3FTK8_9CYAN|nr:NAD(P)-dependent oxidoreductase [Phormidium pseudopriestleyi]MBO0350467.1 NAD(P)-dependent oxidoreductase [Phormidium pseudopriestleyi FRX01]